MLHLHYKTIWTCHQSRRDTISKDFDILHVINTKDKSHMHCKKRFVKLTYVIILAYCYFNIIYVIMTIFCYFDKNKHYKITSKELFQQIFLNKCISYYLHNMYEHKYLQTVRVCKEMNWNVIMTWIKIDNLIYDH